MNKNNNITNVFGREKNYAGENTMQRNILL